MAVAFVPLFAANLDWLEALFVAFVVLSWIGAQIRAVFRRQPPVVRPQAPPPGPAADDDPRAELARQIESFLRDASGRPPAPRDPRRPIEPPAEVRRRTAAAPPRPPKPPVSPRPRPATAAAPPVAGRPMGGLGGHAGDVARHVREAFATPGEPKPAAAATAAPLAPPIPGGAPAGTAPTAAAIAALLRRPAALRELVIAREILDRPEHRW